MKKSKGFTLIELLVVIAIIGILAAIVLVSLAGARNKARDARIQADIGQIRAVAEIHYNDHGYDYGSLEKSNNDYNSLIADIALQKDQQVQCYASGDDYCVSANLTDATEIICISSAGQVGDDYCVAADTTCAP